VARFAVSVLVAIMLVACGGGGASPQATPSTSDSTEPTAPTSEAATDQVVTTPVEVTTPQTLVYAGMEATVREIVVSNATPGTFLDPEPEPGEDAFAYFDVTFAWEDGYLGGSGHVETDWFSLELEEGTTVPNTAVDFKSAYSFREGQPVEAWLAFAVDDAGQVAAASLQVAEAGHVPDVLSLAEAADDGYPIDLGVQEEARVSIEGGCGDGEADVTLTGGEVDLDGGMGHDNERIVLNGMARAETGMVFLRLNFQTVAVSGTCGGAIVNDDQYRLEVDGLPTGPLNNAVELLDPGTGVELIFGWMVPADAELAMIVGTVDGTTATWPIVLPAPG